MSTESTEFQKLTQSLHEKNIALPHFQAYLHSTFTYKFDKLSLILKQQEVDLDIYHQFLKRSFAPSHAFSELDKIEKISLTLLAESKITLGQLNSILRELSNESNRLENMKALALLYKVFTLQKLTPDEFSEWLYRDWKNAPLPKQQSFQFKQSPRFVEVHYATSKKKKQIGPYILLQAVGKGGMGAVYKVYYPPLKQIFALKVLKASKETPKVWKKRFHREIELMKKLVHPGITRIFDSGEDGEDQYIAMEFIEGETLENRTLEDLPLRELLRITKESLEALDYAHQQGVIHRDIKPANIFITKDGFPKIGDFGLAKDLGTTDGDGSLKLTHTGAVLGTTRYMSPEQARGEVALLDARTDIYAIGVCLYKLLTKQFPHDDESKEKIRQRIMTEETVPPSRLNPRIHSSLDHIILKALQKERDNRYPTAKAFADDIERFLQGLAPLSEKVVSLSLKEEWQIFLKPYQKKIKTTLLSLALVFLCYGSLRLFFWLQNSSAFKSAFQQAQNAFQNAKDFEKNSEEPHSTFALDPQYTLVLEALHHSNQAFLATPHSQILSAFRGKLLKEAFRLSLLRKQHTQASSYAKAWEALLPAKHPPLTPLTPLSTFLQNYEHTYAEKELQHFEQKLALLENAILPLKQQSQIVFELAQYRSRLVYERYCSLLHASTLFFQQNPTPSLEEHQRYTLFIRAFGRLGYSLAGQPLFDALEQLIQTPTLSIPQLRFCILLTQSLANTRAKGFSQPLEKIRVQLGSFFTKKTKRALRTLSLLEQKPKQWVALDFYEQGKDDLAQEDYEEAILSFHRALRLPNRSRTKIRNFNRTRKSPVRSKRLCRRSRNAESRLTTSTSKICLFKTNRSKTRTARSHWRTPRLCRSLTPRCPIRMGLFLSWRSPLPLSRLPRSYPRIFHRPPHQPALPSSTLPSRSRTFCSKTL
jgi:serine/threonine protein kinase